MVYCLRLYVIKWIWINESGAADVLSNYLIQTFGNEVVQKTSKIFKMFKKLLPIFPILKILSLFTIRLV